MRIGLLRHFPVALKFPTGLRTAGELAAWLHEYDQAEINPIEADLGGISWRACLSSDLPRAQATAVALFQGPIERTALLREPQFAAFATGNLRLPVWIWKWSLWLSWATGHRSQRPCRDEFQQRVNQVADRIETMKEDTLIVSHAAMMAHLSTELRRRGFSGPQLRIAKHATVYLFERR